MSTRLKVLIVILALTAAFALGRFTVPEKVKIETKIVEVEKKVEDKNKDADKHKTTTTVTTKNPDGSETTTTTTHEDSAVHTHDHEVDNNTTSTDTVKEVTRGRSPVTVLALAGIPLSFGSVTPIYGASVSKPVLGPIAIGIWALSNSTAGVSLGLQF